MIRFANNSDIPDLKRLWSESFGDDDEYIEFFFAKKYSQCKAFVYCDDNGKLCSAMYSLPCIVNGAKAQYIYAASTFKNERSTGKMSALINASHEYCKQNNISYSVLVPACQKLYNFYSHLGYTDGYYSSVITVKRDEQSGANVSFFNCDAHYVFCERSKFNRGKYTVFWDEQAINYAYDEAVFSGNEWLGFKGGYALVSNVDGKPFIKELVCNSGNTDEIIRSMLCHYGADEIVVRLPYTDNLPQCKSGMIYSIDKSKIISDNKKDSYIGLFLD